LESEVAQVIAGRVEVTVTGAERARLVAAPSLAGGLSELSEGAVHRKKRQ